MKKILILVNFILAAILVWSIVGAFSGVDDDKKVAQPIVRRKESRREQEKKNNANKPGAQAPVVAQPVPERAEMAQFISKNDAFDESRCLAIGGGRIEMTLVGTFQVGNVLGAVIRMKQMQKQQRNPFMEMLPGMGENGNNGDGNSGRTRRGKNGGRFRQRFNNSNNSAATEMQKQRLNRQYVKVGETLGNGYTLTEVTRTRATLMRGSDKVELTLQDPSKSLSSASNTGAPRLNATQQLQQAQLMTQQMMMRMMMNMNRNGQGGNGGMRPNFGNSGGRRNRNR